MRFMNCIDNKDGSHYKDNRSNQTVASVIWRLYAMYKLKIYFNTTHEHITIATPNTQKIDLPGRTTVLDSESTVVFAEQIVLLEKMTSMLLLIMFHYEE